MSPVMLPTGSQAIRDKIKPNIPANYTITTRLYLFLSLGN